MNLEFSEEARAIGDQARRFLEKRDCRERARAALSGEAEPDVELWREMVAFGWIGSFIPEEYGGNGAGYEALCVIAEEIGRSLAPVPFASNILAGEVILRSGTQEQKSYWLPKIASGEMVGTLALHEAPGRISADAITLRYENGRLTGRKCPVPDGAQADFAVVVARDSDGSIVPVLAFFDETVTRTRQPTIDDSRAQAELHFDGTPGERLGSGGSGAWAELVAALDRAAVILAFEEVGGAQACLDLAVEYAKTRHAFGRPIGANQAIKHKLANVYVAVELARSNAMMGALGLLSEQGDLAVAAATARVSAIQAFIMASSESIQTHGGIGFTWEADTNLFYRRANALALGLGTESYWKERLVSGLEQRHLA